MIYELKNYSMEGLQKWAVERGLRAFNGRQIFQWLHRHMALNADDMSNVSKNVREMLKEQCSFQALTVEKHTVNEDASTEKLLLKTKDGHFVETVLIHADNRETVCVSSQIGCAMGCAFCQTAQMGMIRDLETAEIVDQVIMVQKTCNIKASNVVFMGMGEPMNNYDNMIRAAYIFNDEQGQNIGARHITISTCGVIPGIQKLAREEKQFKLAVSLNATDQILREKLMPVSRAYPLDDLIRALRDYVSIKNKLITFEYVLLHDVNDTSYHAERLSELLMRVPCKLNLIPYNETDGDFKRPSEADAKAFYDIVSAQTQFPVTIRNSGGKGIKAACGQLYADTVRQ